MDRAIAFLLDILELGALGAFVTMIACLVTAFGG